MFQGPGQKRRKYVLTACSKIQLFQLFLTEKFKYYIIVTIHGTI